MTVVLWVYLIGLSLLQIHDHSHTRWAWVQMAIGLFIIGTTVLIVIREKRATSVRQSPAEPQEPPAA